MSAAPPIRLWNEPAPLTVTQGFVDLFMVRVVDGTPEGRRTFLLRLERGHVAMPLPLVAEGDGALGVIAIAGLDGTVVPAEAGPPDAAQVDAWVGALCLALTAERAGWQARTGTEGAVRLPAGERLFGQGAAPLWVSSTEPGVRWMGMLPLDSPLPLSAATWAESEISHELNAARSEALARDGRLEPALEFFHRAAMIVLAARQQALRDEERRQHLERETVARRALGNGLSALARVVRDDGDAPAASVTEIGRPTLAALRVVAAEIGMTLASPAADEPGDSALDDEATILRASGLRGRQVLLRGDWWRHENGPLLARWEDSKAPVALVWRRNGYVLVDPADGRTRPVDAETAFTLSPLATMLYPRLPASGVHVRVLFDLLGTNLRRDAGRLAFLSVLAAVLGLGVPVAMGLLVDQVIPNAARDQLGVLVAGLVAAALCSAALELGKGMLVRRIEGRADAVIQAAFFDRLLRLPPRFFKSYTAGDLADRVLGVQAIRQLLSGSAAMSLLTGVFSLANLALLFVYDARLALIGLGVAVAASVPSVVWGILQLRHERDLARNRGRVEGFVFQLLSAVGKLKVAAALDRAIATWADRYALQRTRFVAAQRLANAQAVFQAALGPLGMVVLFVTVSWLVKHDLSEAMTAAQANGTTAPQPKGLGTGDFLAFNAAFGQFLAGVTLLCKTVTMVLAVFPMIERIRPLVECATEDDSQKHSPGQLKGAIEFSRVNFAYGAGMPQVLNRLGFRIEPGEFIAIVGPSGGGKSTIMRLMMGIETPDDGEIFYDGRPMSTLNPTALRNRLGVVLQNGRILPGTVLSNIQGGTNCRLEDAWEVARMVGLEDDIRAMPMGMQTVLQEGGGTLSGGQKQRLLIARALARKPRVLLLDEATSALDNQTQAIVTRTLRDLGITRVVIAHRLSTIEQVDRVLVIDQGRLVQDGPFATLRDSPGLLSDFIRRQSL